MTSEHPTRDGPRGDCSSALGKFIADSIGGEFGQSSSSEAPITSGVMRLDAMLHAACDAC